MTNKDITLKNEDIKVYEVGYLLLPILDEDGVSKEVSKIKDIIEKNKGIFLSEGAPQTRTLTYPMKKSISGKNQKFDNAYFGWIKFEASSDVIKIMKDKLDKIDSILRYLLINTIKENTTITVKTGKFSFSKKDESKIKASDDKKEVKIIDSETEKELDETIDDLVIE